MVRERVGECRAWTGGGCSTPGGRCRQIRGLRGSGKAGDWGNRGPEVVLGGGGGITLRVPPLGIGVLDVVGGGGESDVHGGTSDLFVSLRPPLSLGVLRALPVRRAQREPFWMPQPPPYVARFMQHRGYMVTAEDMCGLHRSHGLLLCAALYCSLATFGPSMWGL